MQNKEKGKYVAVYNLHMVISPRCSLLHNTNSKQSRTVAVFIILWRKVCVVESIAGYSPVLLDPRQFCPGVRCSNTAIYTPDLIPVSPTASVGMNETISRSVWL
jgi:hypothetical protein